MKNIILIGLPGCGKTTLGRLAAAELEMNFADCDEEIEKSCGKTVTESFADCGENGFREIETEVLKSLLCRENTVISTGGGIVERDENVSELKKHGNVIYINRSVEDICADIDTSGRPLLKDGAQRVARLAERRNPLYRGCAEVEIENRGDIDGVVRKIIREAEKING